MNGPVFPLLHLTPEEAGAARLLGRFARRRPGITIVRPSSHSEPWRASVDAGTVPGDCREMILTANLPSELLGKLDDLFEAPEDDTG